MFMVLTKSSDNMTEKGSSDWYGFVNQIKRHIEAKNDLCDEEFKHVKMNLQELRKK